MKKIIFILVVNCLLYDFLMAADYVRRSPLQNRQNITKQNNTSEIKTSPNTIQNLENQYNNITNNTQSAIKGVSNVSVGRYELNGMFVGVALGLENISYELQETVCGYSYRNKCQYYNTVTKTHKSKNTPIIDLIFGYKHFDRFVGLRYYVVASLVNANTDKFKSTYLSLEGYVDNIWNFINREKFIFGMYYGIGFVYDNIISISGYDSNRLGGFGFGTHAGLRTVISYRHSIELGFKFSMGFDDRFIANAPYVAYNYLF